MKFGAMAAKSPCFAHNVSFWQHRFSSISSMQSVGMLTFNWFTYLIGSDVCAKWLYSAFLFFFFDFACSCVLQLHFGDLHGREQGIGVKCREHVVHGWCVYGHAMLPRHLHFCVSIVCVVHLCRNCSPPSVIPLRWVFVKTHTVLQWDAVWSGWMVAAVALTMRA